MESPALKQAQDLFDKRDFEGAMEQLDLVLQDNMQDDAALVMMAKAIALTSGDLFQVIGHYMLAIDANPSCLAHKEAFVGLAGAVTLAVHNPHMEKILTRCLETPGLDCSGAQILWYSIFCHHPDFKKIFKMSNAGAYVSFNEKAFGKITDYRPFLAPFFLKGVEQIVVCHPVFESFMTCLRAALLTHVNDSGKLKLTPDEHTQLAAAVSCYCFRTEYIFDVAEKEQKQVDALRGQLETSVAVAVYACYAPLYSLDNARGLPSAGIETVIKMQVEDYFSLKETGESITALTDIEDAVSISVREQYEEFPYPRWHTVGALFNQTQLQAELNHDGKKILIAGCGTGRQSVMYARACPRAEILAVDLSRASLSYAIGKAQELGIKNISFHQADILRLGVLDKTFDHIACTGVLHHMAEPLSGWRVLAGLLKPGGSMSVGLYCASGRRNVTAARAVIQKQGYASDRAGMKAFRRDSAQLLDRADFISLQGQSDYFYMSMYRDLLFHVQEKNYTIPELGEACAALGLSFGNFVLPDVVLAQYKKDFPDDMQAVNLANWQAFEEKYPGAFGTMYQFWCRKL